MKQLTPARLSMLMFMIVGGLIIAYLAKGLLAVEERKAAMAERRNVPMPIGDLPAGTMITESHLGMGPMFAADMTRDVLLQNRVIVGRVTKEPLKAAEPIHSGQLYERGVLPPLTIAEGMRAVSLDLGTTAIVDGLVKPGQFVDVHFSPTSLAGDPRMGGGMTLTIFKGVQILAINRQAQQGVVEDGATNSVTLELSPEQANMLLVARDRGTLAFSYNPQGKGDGGVALKGKDRATLEEILGLAPPEAARTNFTSQIYRGTGRTEIQFDARGNRINETGGTSAPASSPGAPSARVPARRAPAPLPANDPADQGQPSTGPVLHGSQRPSGAAQP
jgi:pilus assembly protein CpaB